MPARTKRSSTGITSSFSSLNLSTSAPSSAESGSKVKECVCKACTCGRHRCTGREHSNVASVGGGRNSHFTASTENRDEYVTHDLPKHVLVKQKYDLPPQRQLEGTSESHDQYIERPLPEKYPKHVNKYAPNPAKFDGISEQHDKFQPPKIAAARPVKFKKVEWKPSKDHFDGATTTKTDYVEWQTERVKPIKKPQEYIPPSGKMMGTTSYDDEYKKYENVKPHQKKKAAAWQQRVDDRDFSSTARTDYVAYSKSDIHRPVKHIEPYAPNANKFAGSSTQQSDFVPIDLTKVRAANPMTTPNARKVAALVDRQGTFSVASKSEKFNGLTEYVETYRPCTVPQANPGKRIVSRKYEPSQHKFEGITTQRTDFQEPSTRNGDGLKVYQRMTFKPVQEPRNSTDDRDFLTETKTGFPEKRMAKCPVIERGIPADAGDDGHHYYQMTAATH